MKQVAVFCGSSMPEPPMYLEKIKELADALIQNELDLVYGGAKVGLMGAVAQRCLEGKRAVIGVIPRALSKKEIVNSKCTEVHLVDSMHARKSMMMEKADAFVVFPGGIGTMEEMFEVWTWCSIGIFNKPIGILNIDGYFDSLLQFFDKSEETGLLRAEVRRKLVVSSEPNELLNILIGQSSKTILHIQDELDFDSADGGYGKKAFEKDGFIHCCLEGQLKGVIERYYQNQKGLNVMKIEVSKLDVPLVYENTSGGKELFPHLYGSFNPQEMALSTKPLEHYL